MTDAKNEDDHPPNKFGWRHMQILFLSLGMATASALRVCISVALEAMTDRKSKIDVPIYEWDSYQKNTILSSVVWGLVLTQIPAGQIANTHSAQKLLAFGLGVSSIISLFTPFLAQYGYVPVIVSRVAVGLLHGCVMPCMQTLISRWAPPLERARLGLLVLNGQPFGTVVTMPISGVLAASSIGWPSVFYVFGGIGITSSVLYFFLGADRPSDHFRISPKEANYINRSLGNLDKLEKLITPWKSLLTSMSMWSILIAHCGHSWGFFFLLTKLPAYMKNVLNYDISSSGTASAVPYLTMWLLGFPISWACDYALRKQATITVVRKISNTIGLWVPAAALIVLSATTTNNTTILIAILSVAVGFNSAVNCGFMINHIDLSPNFAGIMMALTNMAGNISAMIAPLVCGVIITDETDSSQWHIMFYITAGIYFASNLIFIIIGSGEIQSWNYPDGKPITDQNRKVSMISMTGELPILVSVPKEIKEENC